MAISSDNPFLNQTQSIQPNPTMRQGWTGTDPRVTAQQETIPQAPMTFDSNLNQQQFDSPLTIGYQTEDITGMLGESYGESFVNSGGMELSTEIQDGLNELKKVSVEKNMTGWDKFNKVMNTAYENLMKPETYPLVKMFFEARNGGEIQDVLLAGADASMEVKKSMLDNAFTQAQINNFPTAEEKAISQQTAQDNLALIDAKIKYYNRKDVESPDITKFLNLEKSLLDLDKKQLDAFNKEIAAMTPQGIGKINPDILDISTQIVSSFDMQGKETQLASDLGTYATILFDRAGQSGKPITQSQAVDLALQHFLSEGPLSGTGEGWGEGTYDPTQLNLPSTDVVTVSLSAIMNDPEYAGMSREEIMKQAAMNPLINLVP